MWLLGLGGGYYHDAAACLFNGSRLVSFIEEERLSRLRYAPGQRPYLSVLACLAEADIKLKDLDVICLSWNPYFPVPMDSLSQNDAVITELFPEQIFGKLRAKIVVIDHQRSHAASAYRTFDKDKALVISVDGSGDGKSAGIFSAENGQLNEIASFDVTQSLGWFYQRVTTYLGIGNWHHAGKTMALAALGEPAYDFDFLEIGEDGFRFTHPHGIPLHSLTIPTQEIRSSYYSRQKEYLYEYFNNLGVPTGPVSVDVERTTGNRIYPSLDSRIINLAASAQKAVEDALTALVTKYSKSLNHTNICLAGGVAMNCKAMGLLLSNVDSINHLYVPPFAGDMGGAIGAALETLSLLKVCDRIPLKNAYLGPGFDDDEIKRILGHLRMKFQQIEDPSACAADLIINGKVIGWFQGKMEVGPRALGNRSILARPDSIDIRDRLNIDIKNRESWRPFSPSSLDGSFVQEGWSRADEASPFMTVALTGTECSDHLKGVRHTDRTSRLQIVKESENPRFAKILEQLGQVLGAPVVLNTSLNARDEPIACRPIEAIRTFSTTPLDALIIGNSLLTK